MGASFHFCISLFQTFIFVKEKTAHIDLFCDLFKVFKHLRSVLGKLVQVIKSHLILRVFKRSIASQQARLNHQALTQAACLRPSFGAVRVIPKMTSQELHTQGQKTNKRPLGPAAHILGCPGLPPCTQGPPSMVAPVGGATTPQPPPARPLVPEAGSSENTDEQRGTPSTDSGSGCLALLHGTV